MPNEPFFTRDGAIYQPTPASRGPWDPKSLHGRVIVGLLGHVLEQQYGEPDFIPARLTVDMYRLPDHSPVEVKTTLVRAGGRIKVVDAEFISGGVSAGRATCQFLRRTENAPGEVWKPEDWDAPSPENTPPPDDGRAGMGGMWEARPIKGGFGHFGQKQTWMREVREIVGGEPLTPFSRIAVASDFASPFAHAGTEGLGYINSDVSLYLHRLPAGEWVGFESVDHHADDGVAVGGCRLYDEQGSIGAAYCAALAQRRAPRP